ADIGKVDYILHLAAGSHVLLEFPPARRFNSMASPCSALCWATPISHESNPFSFDAPPTEMPFTE
ncbi:MAG: hypothetical protein ACO3OK_10425, partial [Limisphaerales bacterium]